jgi:hypothetical protein
LTEVDTGKPVPCLTVSWSALQPSLECFLRPEEVPFQEVASREQKGEYGIVWKAGDCHPQSLHRFQDLAPGE